MLKVDLEYRDAIESIDDMINRMPRQLAESEPAVLRKIGNTIKGHVVRSLHSSDVEVRAKQIVPGIEKRQGDRSSTARRLDRLLPEISVAR